MKLVLIQSEMVCFGGCFFIKKLWCSRGDSVEGSSDGSDGNNAGVILFDSLIFGSTNLLFKNCIWSYTTASLISTSIALFRRIKLKESEALKI